MGFNVFIERARDPSPAALERTAQALSARYGFPPAVILDRLRSGRFAAWSNLDHATARRCAGELEAFGIVCSVADDDATPAPLPTPPAPPARTLAGMPPVRPSSPAPGGYASGLAAAYGDQAAKQDLGALAGGTDGAWQIASLDGAADEPATEVVAKVSFRPPGAPPPMPGAPRPAPASVEDYDRFAPPDAAREAVLELDAPSHAPPSQAPSSHGAPSHAAPSHAPAAGAAAAVAIPPAPAADAPLVTRVLEQISEGRANLAVGVLLAVLLGFVPATLVASARERSYDDVRAELGKTFAAIDGPAAWDSASDAREAAVATVEQRRSHIAITALVVWALGFAGAAFVWFRVIDWDFARPRRIMPPVRRSPATR